MGEDVNELPLSIRVFRNQYLKKIVKSEASVERVFFRHELILSPLIHSEISHTKLFCWIFQAYLNKLSKLFLISKSHSETVNRRGIDRKSFKNAV